MPSDKLSISLPRELNDLLHEEWRRTQLQHGMTFGRWLVHPRMQEILAAAKLDGSQ